MVATNPMRIPGPWRQGFVLDYHTVSSVFLGHDEFGNAMFDTKRSEVGELLYQLKYRRNRKAIVDLVEVATRFVKRWKPPVDAIAPVPATRVRLRQPVVEIATALGKRLDLPVLTGLLRPGSKPKELKNVFDYDERIKLLEGVYMIEGETVR
jgi:predicted amidophosphoribosyltransferase